MYARLDRTILFALALFAVLPQAVAQSPGTLNVLGEEKTLTQLQTSVLDGTFWTETVKARVDLADCNEKRLAAADAEVAREAKPAAERYAAAKRYEECLAIARALVVAGAGELAGAASLSLQSLENNAAENSKERGAEANFIGISFGVGVGISYSQDELISAAEIAADGTIRATETETQQPRVIFESHYYGFCKSPRCNAGEFGVGPFFGIVAKDEKLISAFAAGVMVGWKDKKAGEADGFSVGIGAILDADVSSLADGFEEGQPLPTGETEIRFESKSRWGALLFFTRTF